MIYLQIVKGCSIFDNLEGGGEGYDSFNCVCGSIDLTIFHFCITVVSTVYLNNYVQGGGGGKSNIHVILFEGRLEIGN